MRVLNNSFDGKFEVDDGNPIIGVVQDDFCTEGFKRSQEGCVNNYNYPVVLTHSANEILREIMEEIRAEDKSEIEEQVRM